MTTTDPHWWETEAWDHHTFTIAGKTWTMRAFAELYAFERDLGSAGVLAWDAGVKEYIKLTFSWVRNLQHFVDLQIAKSTNLVPAANILQRIDDSVVKLMKRPLASGS